MIARPPISDTLQYYQVPIYGHGDMPAPEMLAVDLLSSAAVGVVRSYLGKRGASSSDDSESVDLPDVVVAELQDQVESLEESEPSVATVLGAAVPAPAALPTTLGGAALAISATEVFQDARNRNKRVYLFNLVLAIVLATLLCVTIAGALVSFLVLQATAASAVFAGVSILDLFGFAFTKPFTVIQQSSVATQRLDLAYLRLQEQMKDCDLHEDPASRFDCRAVVWDTIQSELRSLGGA